MKIAPGIRVNFSKRGMGVSVGTRGMHVSRSATGRKTFSAGIPGTGISYRETISPAKRTRKPRAVAPDSTAQSQEMVNDAINANLPGVVTAEALDTASQMPPADLPGHGPNTSEASREVTNLPHGVVTTTLWRSFLWTVAVFLYYVSIANVITPVPGNGLWVPAFFFFVATAISRQLVITRHAYRIPREETTPN
jgi:hypothetical protein